MAPRTAYRRRAGEISLVNKSPLPRSVHIDMVIHGRVRSDICWADPTHVPVAAVDPHSGGRQRDPRPQGLAPLGVVVPARPERRVGFVFGPMIGRVR